MSFLEFPGQLIGHYFGDAAPIRRAMRAYRQVRLLHEQLRTCSPSERRMIVQNAYSKTVAAYMATRHGSRISHGEDIPLLRKEEVRKSPDSFRTRGLCLRASTSGSTGVPLEMCRSLSCVAAEQASIDYILSLAGIDPRRAKIAVLRANSLVPVAGGRRLPFRRIGRNRLVLSPYLLNQANLPEYVQQIEAFRPDVLMAYPSSAEHLCDLLESAGVGLTVDFVMTSSEVLTPAVRQRIAGILGGATVMDLYGQGERVCMAYSLEAGQYWFLPGYGKAELVPLDTECTLSEHSGSCYEIVGTGFWNERMPLVRYRTGDMAVLPEGLSQSDLDAVALGEKSFLGILGRTADWIRLPDGSRAIGLNHLPWGIRNVSRMQVLQHTDGAVTLAVKPEEGFSQSDEERILASARRLLGPEIPLRIIVTETLTVDSNGKTPFVIREIDSE